MQQGIFFLWVFSILSSMAEWFWVAASLSANGTYRNRRQLTGCELARQILDKNHLGQIPVEAVPSRGTLHLGDDYQRLLLDQKTFYGTRVANLSAAFHETAHFLMGFRTSAPFRLPANFSKLRRIAVTLSWTLIIAGAFFRSLPILILSGQLIFVIAFFSAVTALGEEWEMAEHTNSILSALEGLGADEVIRIRRTLRTMRLSPPAEIFEAPFAFLFQNKKEKIPVQV